MTLTTMQNLNWIILKEIQDGHTSPKGYTDARSAESGI